MPQKGAAGPKNVWKHMVFETTTKIMTRLKNVCFPIVLAKVPTMIIANVDRAQKRLYYWCFEKNTKTPAIKIRGQCPKTFVFILF